MSRGGKGLHEPLPEFFCQKRHERMCEAKRGFIHVERGGPVLVLARILAKSKLLDFEIPVAHFVPDEMPDFVCGLVIAMLSERLVYTANRAVKTAVDPGVLDLIGWKYAATPRSNSRALQVHEEQTRSIPEFVCKGPAGVQAIFFESDIGSGRRRHKQTDTAGIGTEAIHDFEWIDHVALCLRHLLAFGVAH
jgi:hypothetical protein